MFSKRERLSRTAFPKALSGGQRVSSLNFSATSSKETKGYAVIVSKKVARLSVTRHLIRRRVLAALRTFPLPSSLIIFPKASAKTLKPQDLKSELAVLLSKIKK